MDFSLLSPKSFKKPTPPLAVPSPFWAFYVWGPWKTEIRIEQRAGEVGFWDLGGLKWTVVEDLEGAVVEKPAVGSGGSGNLMPRSHQTHR